MKRFWLVLLALGLIVATATVSFAQVTVRFSGEFYAGGLYLDRIGVRDVNQNNLESDSVLMTPAYWLANRPAYYANSAWDPYAPATYVNGAATRNDQSTAFYFQRLRLTSTFIVAPGLFFITRMDAMERSWGAQRSDVPLDSTLDTLSAGTRAENENIAIDLAYLTYISPYGIISAGYQIDNAWGTVFGDNSLPTGKVGYAIKISDFTLGIQTGKNIENSYTRTNVLNGNGNMGADRDSSFYTAFVKYNWKGGEAGFLAKYIVNSASRDSLRLLPDAFAGFGPAFYPLGTKTQTLSLLPYVKAQLGPVALQAEIIYTMGKVKFDDDSLNTRLYIANVLGQPLPGNIDISQLSAWIDATADFGMFYAGGTLAYLSGDKPDTSLKIEGGGSGGIDWNPTLILFNNDLTYWQGGITGWDGTSTAGAMSNAFFAQVRGGVRPVEKLDLGLAVSWAKAERHPVVGHWAGREYGIEVDATATYKITNNLSYMLGAGYLFTGDYFKGDEGGLGAVLNVQDVENDYMVINKLTLTF